jgi:HlyD family secretion protein
LVSRIHKGQPAVVRVDAMPNRPLKAHVESVANTPSQQDFFAADVKVYATKIYIDEEVDGLKPGMTAVVAITVADALEHVLTVPISAIIGSSEMGATRKCFIVTPQGPKEQDVVVGLSNEMNAEIVSGLTAGDEVVLNPKVLVGDKVKTREAGEQPKNGNSSPENGGKGGRAGKGAEGKGPAGPVPGGPNGSPGPGLKGKAGGQTGGLQIIPAEAGPRGGPGAGVKGKTGGQPGGLQMSAEEQETRRKEMVDRFRQASPEKRKEMLEQVPAEFRGRAKDALKAAGVQVKD